MTEDEMVGWHHRLHGHGFGWTLGVGDGQEGLACCSSWGHKESDMTERRTELNYSLRNQNEIEYEKEYMCSFIYMCVYTYIYIVHTHTHTYIYIFN